MRQRLTDNEKQTAARHHAVEKTKNECTAPVAFERQQVTGMQCDFKGLGFGNGVAVRCWLHGNGSG